MQLYIFPSFHDFTFDFTWYYTSNNFIIPELEYPGELIYIPSTFLKSFYVLYFDPKRNILRRVEFKGIADDGFRFSNEPIKPFIFLIRCIE